MIRVYLLFMLLLLCGTHVAIAQQNYNQTEPFLKANAFWAWYDNNGLDFSNGSPVHDSTAFLNSVTDPYAFQGAGVASASDPATGQLLFYSDGQNIWNRNHVVMSNGSGLLGNWKGASLQGTSIVPAIGDPGKYYVFSLGGGDAYIEDSSQAGLYYSVVDMSLDNGNGGVIPGEKNLLLNDDWLLEAMIAIPGNNCNVWLIVHEFSTDWLLDPPMAKKNYLAYEITSSGVNSVPVASEGLSGAFSSKNHFSVSPDRSTVFLADVQLSLGVQVGASLGTMLHGAPIPVFSELMHFDPSTGMFSDGIKITPPPNFSFSAGAFSPGGEKLYVTQTNRFSEENLKYAMLMQMDISVLDSTAINSTIITIDTLPVDAAIDLAVSLKSYRDSIYVFYANANVIGRVNHPDSTGLLCHFEPSAIQLPIPYKTDQLVASPPSEVVYSFSASNEVALDTAICGEIILVPIIEANNIRYTWSDSTIQTTLQVQAPGTYWVKYQAFYDNCIYFHTDTFKVNRGSVDIPPTININVHTLGTSVEYASYQWLLNGDIIDDATSRYYSVTQNGSYQVIVTDDNLCVDTSNVYKVENYTSISDFYLSEIRVYPNPSEGLIFINSKVSYSFDLLDLNGRTIINRGKGDQIDLRHYNEGIYLLKVYGTAGEPLFFDKIVKLP